MKRLRDREKKTREMKFVCMNFLFSLMTMRKCIFEFKFINSAQKINVFSVHKMSFSLMIFNFILLNMHDFRDKMSVIFL